MGFRGDHDLWDITHTDGRHIQTNPKKANYDADALKRKKELLKDLGQGPTETQHDAHKDWGPTSERDIRIDRKIRKSHYPGGEALLEIMPDQPPRITYEGATMPKKKEWGIQNEVGIPKENVGGSAE